jgi:long-chain acyl-CoA synthetase
VIGRPDPRHGEEVVAFVALHPGAEVTGEELVVWARERIGGYKYPRQVVVIDAVPLTPVGKVDRKALRATLAVAQPEAVARPQVAVQPQVS